MTRVAVIAGSVVPGWDKPLRILVEKLREHGKVTVLTERAYAGLIANALKDLLDKKNVFLRVLGFDRNLEERLLGLYVNINPDLLVYLYRPNVVNGVAYDVGCINVPKHLHGLERLIPLARASNIPIIGFVRHCTNIGSSLLGLECECMDEPTYTTDKAYYTPTTRDLKEVLRSDKSWLW